METRIQVHIPLGRPKTETLTYRADDFAQLCGSAIVRATIFQSELVKEAHRRRILHHFHTRKWSQIGRRSRTIVHIPRTLIVKYVTCPALSIPYPSFAAGRNLRYFVAFSLIDSVTAEIAHFLQAYGAGTRRSL